MNRNKASIPILVRPLPYAPFEIEKADKLIHRITSLAPRLNFQVYWNLPGFMTANEGELPSREIVFLRRITKERGDLILPGGWSGFPQGFLSQDEQEEERIIGRDSWLQVLEEEHLAGWGFPINPDADSLNFEPNQESKLLINLEGPGFPPIPFIDLSLAFPQQGMWKEQRELRRIIKAISNSWGILIGTDREIDAPHCRLIKKLPLAKFVYPSEKPQDDLNNEKVDRGIHPYWSPRWRHILFNPPENPAKVRTALSGLSSPVDHFCREINYRLPEQRTLLADMLGDVILEDDDFAVHFSEGSLAGFSAKGEEIIPKLKTESRFNLSNDNTVFHSAQAYSFEDETTRGLREVQNFSLSDKKNGRFTKDYYFIEGSSYLILTLLAEYPELPRGSVVESSAPAEITLFSVPEEDEITCVINSEKKTVFNTEGLYHPLGGVFHFTAGKRFFTLSLDKKTSLPAMILPVKVEIKDGVKTLSINPLGNYFPQRGEGYSNIREQHSLLIHGGIGNSQIPEMPPGEILDQIPASWTGFKG